MACARRRATHPASPLVTMLVTMLVATLVMGASTAAWSATPVPMKMTTTPAPGISMPDKVETRLGTLEFFDGFPDDASVEKL